MHQVCQLPMFWCSGILPVVFMEHWARLQANVMSKFGLPVVVMPLVRLEFGSVECFCFWVDIRTCKIEVSVHRLACRIQVGTWLSLKDPFKCPLAMYDILFVAVGVAKQPPLINLFDSSKTKKHCGKFAVMCPHFTQLHILQQKNWKKCVCAA